jgi:hypothetical protein
MTTAVTLLTEALDTGTYRYSCYLDMPDLIPSTAREFAALVETALMRREAEIALQPDETNSTHDVLTGLFLVCWLSEFELVCLFVCLFILFYFLCFLFCFVTFSLFILFYLFVRLFICLFIYLFLPVCLPVPCCFFCLTC